MVLIVETGISLMELNCHSPHRVLIVVELIYVYGCDIPTNDVHDDTDISVRVTVCVGLYTANGGTGIRMVFMELTWHYHEINV